MEKSYCEKARIECPQLPHCLVECRYEATRKIKPYPAVPEDIEEVPEVWHRVGAAMLTAIFGVLAVIVIILFFTGAWVWSLLI